MRTYEICDNLENVKRGDIVLIEWITERGGEQSMTFRATLDEKGRPLIMGTLRLDRMVPFINAARNISHEQALAYQLDFLKGFGLAREVDVNEYLDYPFFGPAAPVTPGATLMEHLSPQDALRVKALCCAESWWIKMTEDDVRRVIWFLIEGWRVACAHVGPSSELSQTGAE